MVGCFSASSFAADYYSVGVDAFKKGAYSKAASNLEHAIRINPKNVNARYYLSQVFIRQNRNSEALNQYRRIIMLSPSSDAAILSQKGIALMSGAKSEKISGVSGDILARYKDNYLDYVLSDKQKTMRWASFPINVYIEPLKQRESAKRAFEQWQTKSNGLVRFGFVNSPQSAQITVDFKDKLESTSTKESFYSGFSKPYYQGGKIVKSDIQILTLDPVTKQELENDVIYSTVLHEIGHTLGFAGHSPDEKDVMYAYSSDPKMELTTRDINTLNILYRMDETHLAKRNTGSTDVKLEQALDYVARSPEKSVGWANLAGIYKAKKMYPEAIKNYQKAISLEPDKVDLYNLLGVTYEEAGDYKNAYTNLKRACDADKSNAFYVYSFAKLCLKSGQKEVGRNYLNTFISNNPQKASDGNIQSIMKAYQ